MKTDLKDIDEMMGETIGVAPDQEVPMSVIKPMQFQTPRLTVHRSSVAIEIETEIATGKSTEDEIDL